MTQQQAWDQEERVTAFQVNQCTQAGGDWLVGFANAYCTKDINYRPDWFVEPHDNGIYFYFEMAQAGLAVMGMLLGIIALGETMYMIIMPGGEMDMSNFLTKRFYTAKLGTAVA